MINVIQRVSRIASNLADECKGLEGAISSDVAQALHGATTIPLKKDSPKCKEPPSDENNESRKKSKQQQTNVTEHAMYGASTSDSLELPSISLDSPSLLPAVNPSTPARRREPRCSLTPFKRGDGYLDTWQKIVGTGPAGRTGVSATWLPLLTKVLAHVWGVDGVNNALRMAVEVVENFGILQLDAITSTTDTSSPVRGLAKRLKQVWSLSKRTALQTAEVINHYKYLADDFDRLEKELDDPSAEIGKLWTARRLDPKLGDTEQTRSNFVLRKGFNSMHPEALDDKERNAQISKLRKERMIARNVALMVRTFGFGIIPLVSNTSWRQCFPQFAATTTAPYLTKSAGQEPVLRELCSRLDSNFYQYVRQKGRVSEIPKACLQGLSIKAQHRAKHTVAFLLATPGQIEEPGNLLTARVRDMASDTSATDTGEDESGIDAEDNMEEADQSYLRYLKWCFSA